MSVRKMWQMECPQCHEDDEIDVTARVDVRLVPDGTDADESGDGSHEWDDDSPCYCGHCDYRGTVKDFQIKENVTT